MSLDALAELFTATPPATGPEPTAAAFERQFTAREWAALQRHPDILEALKLAFELERQRRAGILPAHYSSMTTCHHCGPVWIWPGAPARALACPWCGHRADGLPIPRPAPGAAESLDSDPLRLPEL